MKGKLALALLGLPLIGSAQTFFTDNFDSDHTSLWQFNSHLAGDTATDGTRNEADFFFDYSIAGIPSAPHSTGGSTRGLKLEANLGNPQGSNGTSGTGLSVSPIGLNIGVGNFTLQFDAWQNYALTGSGNTQLLQGGILSPTNVSNTPVGTYKGVGFAAATNGGTGTAYRGYNGSGTQIAASNFPLGQAVGGYSALYNGTVPAAQTAYANTFGVTTQTGNAQAGALAMAWRTWKITKNGSTVTWNVDGTNIATITNAVTTNGGNIYVGQFDINASVATETWARNLNFGLVDNILVTPEPGTMAALGLGAVALMRRRRSK